MCVHVRWLQSIVRDAVCVVVEVVAAHKKTNNHKNTKTMVFGQHDNANLMRISFNSFSYVCVCVAVWFSFRRWMVAATLS